MTGGNNLVVTGVPHEPLSTGNAKGLSMPRVVSLAPADRTGEAVPILAYVPMNFNQVLHIGDPVITRDTKHGAHKGLPEVHRRVVRRRGHVTRSSTDPQLAKRIRAWAREQGHELAERGRIPSHIVEAYRSAGGK
ncbi:histone-like nucleoid-structuring protein Lsr2 [Nocardia sp. NPDC052566]|uniref:Lsr2 family DNA-binding protein n=1 Tax=Nocardia sp. NPDC052566 TaxID=3364330 RepID=UPI0037C9F4B7